MAVSTSDTPLSAKPEQSLKVEKGDAAPVKPAPLSEDGGESGSRLALIMAAILLAMFLVALVSKPTNPISHLPNIYCVLCLWRSAGNNN